MLSELSGLAPIILLSLADYSAPLTDWGGLFLTYDSSRSLAKEFTAAFERANNQEDRARAVSSRA
jgi:hypothetical protein